MNAKSKSSLVTNKEAQQFTNFTLNLLAASTRTEVLEGREHIVVPMIILTQGVHHGNKGPLYYPPEELSKTPATWNHKPVVVYHPVMNGESLSACDPAIINTRKIGVMLNTRYEKGKLKSEAWIEKSRADLVDERIMEAVNNNEMMELSTGVFLDVEEKEGEWNTEKYAGIARNFRADHLALLPDQVGACSIEDGAGLLRNSRQTNDSSVIEALKRAGVTLNDMSHSSIHQSIAAALGLRFPTKSGELSTSPWIQDIYSNFVIYELGGKLWRLGYTSSDDTGVELSDKQPVEVRRVTEYRTVAGGGQANNKRETTENTDNKKKSMKKKEIVDVIINSGKGWEETDREALMALNEKQLGVVHNSVTAPPPEAPKTEAPKTEEPKTETPKTEAPAANTQAPKIVTVDDYVAQAPKEIQDVLRNSMSVYDEEKNRLVDGILKNSNNAFTKQDLGGRPLGELRNLAKLAGASLQPLPNYAGQAPAGNTAVKEEPVLEMPTMNFAAKE